MADEHTNPEMIFNRQAYYRTLEMLRQLTKADGVFSHGF